jgi:hypothetical protein
MDGGAARAPRSTLAAARIAVSACVGLLLGSGTAAAQESDAQYKWIAHAGGVEITQPLLRDVVGVLAYVGAPGPGAADLFILDGETGKVLRRRAISFAFTSDGTKVVYAKEHVVYEAHDEDDGIGEKNVDHSEEVARRLGVRASTLKQFEYGDEFGSAYVAQPVVLDLQTGREQALPMVGPAAFFSVDGLIFAAPAFDSRRASKPLQFDLASRRWMDVPARLRDAVRRALETWDKKEQDAANSPIDPVRGLELATTRNAKLKLVLADLDGKIEVAAR